MEVNGGKIEVNGGIWHTYAERDHHVLPHSFRVSFSGRLLSFFGCGRGWGGLGG